MRTTQSHPRCHRAGPQVQRQIYMLTARGHTRTHGRCGYQTFGTGGHMDVGTYAQEHQAQQGQIGHLVRSAGSIAPGKRQVQIRRSLYLRIYPHLGPSAAVDVQWCIVDQYVCV